MARDQRVRIRIEAQDQTSRALGNVESRFSRLRTSIRANAFKIAASLGFVVAAFKEVDRFSTLQSQTEALRRNLALQGVSLDDHVAKLKEVSRQQVSTAQIIEASNKAILLGIPAKEIAKLLDIARASAIATGDTVAKAFDDIVTGIGRASPLILDNLGIVVKLGPAYEAMAASLGKSTTELTAAEQKQALLNEVLKVGAQRVETFGDAQSKASEKINQARATLDDYRNGVSELVSNLLQRWIDFTKQLADEHTRAALAVDNLQGRGEKLEISERALAATAQKYGISVRELTVELEKAVASRKKLNVEEEKVAPAIEVNREHLARLTFELRNAAEAQEILTRTQIRNRQIQRDIAAATEGFAEGLKRIGVRLDREVNEEIEANNKLLEKAQRLYELGEISAGSFARVQEEVAEANRRAREEMEGTVDAIEKYAQASSEATSSVDALSDSTESLAASSTRADAAARSAAAGIQRAGIQAVTTAGQFDQLAASADRATAVQSALAGGARLVQAGRVLEFPGGSRLVGGTTIGGFSNLSGGTFTTFRSSSVTADGRLVVN